MGDEGGAGIAEGCEKKRARADSRGMRRGEKGAGGLEACTKNMGVF